MAPSPLLHRLPKAVLLAVVAALLLGGLVGTVQAADGVEPAGMPDELAIPAPAVGDRWTYQAVLQGGWLVGENDSQDGVAIGQPFPYAEFEWLDPAVVRDAQGLEVAVDRLQANTLRYSGTSDWMAQWWAGGWGDWFSTTDFSDVDAWVPAREVLLLRSGTLEGVAREAATETYGSDGDDANLTTAGGVPVRTWDVETVSGWGRTFGPVDVPCLARWTGQGSTLSTHDGLRVPSDCLPDFDAGFWFSETQPRDVRHEAAAVETVAGHRAVRFDGPGRSIWLSPDVPVPVQWRGVDGGRSATITLTEWTGGFVPVGTPAAAPTLTTAPPIELAERQVWGPDDSGVDHPYPASAAYKAALADPTWPDLRDWMDDHPEAFTFLLEYNEDLSKTPQERQWLFVLTDGGDTWGFVATQSTIPGFPLPPTTRHQEAGWTSGMLDILAPDPDVVPDRLPTVASVLRRWAAYEATEGRGDAPNGWGMAIHCPVGCLDLSGLIGYTGVPSIPSFPFGDFQKLGYAEVVAGKDPIALMRVEDLAGFQPGAPGLPGERTFHGSQLTVRNEVSDSAAETTRLIQWTGYASSGAAVGPLSTQDTVPPTGDPADKEGAGARLLAAFLPTPEQGAAITLASALAGLVYWLWPTLKGGAAGLFSRLAPPQLLEHPGRARLHALIQAEPGIHFQDLVRRSGLANGTAVHHLHKLEQGDLIAVRPLGRYTCYFPGSSPDRATLAAAPVTRSDGARRILAELAANPGLSGQEVASRLGLQQSTVAYHVKRLQEAGLVASQREGRTVRLRAVAAS